MRIALLIGRFQPFHTGHRALLEAAETNADRVCLVLGSDRAAPSLRNPWSSSERLDLIRLALGRDFDYVLMPDSDFDTAAWYRDLTAALTGRYGGGHEYLVVGHRKDASSRYLDEGPGWPVMALPLQAGGLGATALRRKLMEGHGALDGLNQAQQEWLECWRLTSTAKTLQEEYRHVQAYRATWARAPYPPIFVTADALVFHRQHVLLIRRGNFPGAGQWALPGGFLEQDEVLEAAARRELQEETGLYVADYPELARKALASRYCEEPERDPRGRMITHAFAWILDPRRDPPVLQGLDDAALAVWMPLAELESHRQEFFSDHLRLIGWFRRTLARELKA